MKNFHTQKLVEIWQKAVGLYQSGHQKSVDFPLDDDLPFLQELGMNKMDIFDFAEDWLCEGEPDLATFLLIHEQRRDYFWEVQNRVSSSIRLDSSSLPSKDSEIEGIRWLPRIIPKAKPLYPHPKTSIKLSKSDKQFIEKDCMTKFKFTPSNTTKHKKRVLKQVKY